MAEDNVPRWVRRFDNFDRAFRLLSEFIEVGKQRPLTEMEKLGLVQCFELTFELAWKTMYDYLLDGGISFDSASPRSIIREAFNLNLISNGQEWTDALDARNEMSHTYDMQKFEIIVEEIKTRYSKTFQKLHEFLQAKTHV
jgi:nucleotidyltransferase substrate binding protein (TIGR01987 family)